MNLSKCSTCKKPIQPGDKFCQHCGAPQSTAVSAKENKAPVRSDSIAFNDFIKWILIAVVIGVAFGWVRYWIGYYVLIQGVIAGLLIPFFVKNTAKNQLEALSNIRFKTALLLFVFFLLAQALGFGMAQPVFDPFMWFIRVWNGDTSESVFAIFSTAGVVHRTFSEGINGGFWILLSAIDLFFMFFFILVSMPLTSKKTKS
ncbi:zinc ribbon domain-containing protein [uncultured Draconibacterium sp.]|uniref:zinc ribbon domain-containing protein n=1 Tax=uncultured Draconibacterium sp. TaxID=1573823 RepID=UPI00321690C2